MTWIFWAPASVRTTSNSSFSSSTGAAAAPPPAGGGDGDGSGGGDAELLFERVEQFLELDHGQVGDGVEDVFLRVAMVVFSLYRMCVVRIGWSSSGRSVGSGRFASDR